jgi:hypothetical protein
MAPRLILNPPYSGVVVRAVMTSAPLAYADTSAWNAKLVPAEQNPGAASDWGWGQLIHQ